MSKAKEILAKVKLLFADETPAPATIVVKTADGTELAVDKLEVGGQVMINGVAAPENTYVLEDGSSIKVDATGKIIEVIAKAEEAADKDKDKTEGGGAPPATSQMRKLEKGITLGKFAAEDQTPAGLQAMFDSFATGTPEERIANLEIVARALMEYSFGWEIRQAKEKQERDAAIKIYTDQLKNATTTIATQQQAMAKQEGKLKEMFALVVSIAEETPASEAPGANDQGEKKLRYGFSEGKSKQTGSLGRFQKAAAKLREMEEAEEA